MEPTDLDEIDRIILRALQRNARITTTELAALAGRSKTPIAARVRQLEKSGVITAYRAVLSPTQMGLNHVTYVEVRMHDTREAALLQFNAAVKDIPEVEECYMIAGGFDYLLKVRSRDIAHYRTVMGDHISALPGVASTSSFVAMEAVIENAEIDIGT